MQNGATFLLSFVHWCILVHCCSLLIVTLEHQYNCYNWCNWCNGVPVGALQRMDEAVWQQLLSPSAAKSSSSCAKHPTWLGGIVCQRHRKTGSTQRCKNQELLRKSQPSFFLFFLGNERYLCCPKSCINVSQTILYKLRHCICCRSYLDVPLISVSFDLSCFQMTLIICHQKQKLLTAAPSITSSSSFFPSDRILQLLLLQFQLLQCLFEFSVIFLSAHLQPAAPPPLFATQCCKTSLLLITRHRRAKLTMRMFSPHFSHASHAILEREILRKEMFCCRGLDYKLTR